MVRLQRDAGAALRMPTLPIPSGAETAGIVAMYLHTTQ
jgi:hypothetical protein